MRSVDKSAAEIVTARLFIGSMVHYGIVQEILHDREILAMDRDRFVDGLIQLIVS